MVYNPLFENSCSQMLITFYITFPSIVNVNANTFNMHLHCFGKGNFQTLDMHDVMTAGNKCLVISVFKMYCFHIKCAVHHILVRII